jgi:hypothetical protein
MTQALLYIEFDIHCSCDRVLGKHKYSTYPSIDAIAAKTRGLLSYAILINELKSHPLISPIPTFNYADIWTSACQYGFPSINGKPWIRESMGWPNYFSTR